VTRPRNRKRWLCKNNHPLVGRNRNGEPYCMVCAKMNRFVGNVGSKTCPAGHTRLATTTRCSTCDQYRNTPWLKELDETGHALCPNGHSVSHYTPGSLKYYLNGRRLCAACMTASLELRRGERIEPDARTVCRNGIHPWPESEGKRSKDGKRRCLGCNRDTRIRRYWARKAALQSKRELAPDWVDWAVVHRALQGVPDDRLYDISRGQTRGMTPGEKWVAYCTYEKQYGKPGKGNSPATREDKFLRWYEETIDYGFKPITLGEILADLPSGKYRLNRML
jgi:hypothetical protein